MAGGRVSIVRDHSDSLISVISSLIFAVKDVSGEQRDDEFVVACDGIATACAIGYGATNDVCQRAIGLDEIEIGGRDAG